MKKRFGIFVMLAAVLAFVGYQAMQAAPGNSRRSEKLALEAAKAATEAMAAGKMLDSPVVPVYGGAPKASPDEVLNVDDSEDPEKLAEFEAQAKALVKAEAEAEALKEAEAEAEAQSQLLSSGPEVLVESAISDEERDALLGGIADKYFAGVEISMGEKELAASYLEMAANERALRDRDDPLDNGGGPDVFGYYYVDNVGDTATYDWIELCGDPNATDGPSGDDASLQATWGWNFPFYGADYTSVWVATNGLMQFNASNTTFTNLCPFASGNPTNPQIAPYWDDMNSTYGGGCSGAAPYVRWRDFGTYFVVQWEIAHHTENGSLFKFEAILFPDGKIKFQYHTISTTAFGNSASIGIDANGAGRGVEYGTCNATTLPNGTSGRAVWIFQGTFVHDFATTHVLAPAGYTPASTLVDVIARFANGGTTVESATVAYSFNGGATQTATTDPLAQYGVDTVTFGAQILTPATPGIYTLRVWSELTNDEFPSNDTIQTVVQVGGDNCTEAIPLIGDGPTEVQFGNCGSTTDNTPGQPCGASGKDLVFSIEVPNGSQVEVWLGANTITARHTLRWGGACPGDNFVDCLTTETRRFRFVNNTGSNEIAYYTVGNSTAPGTCGTYRVGWELTPCATLDIPVLETFDAVATPVLPSCWGTVQALPLTATTSPTWESYSTTPYSAPNSASILGAATGNDDWLFSPGISLTGGQGYVLDFWWRGASTTVPESLEVMAGIANTSGDMTETVFALDTIKSTVYQQFFGGFTPGADGIYYLGFHNTTKRSAGRTRIDDVQFYEVGGCSAPDVTVNAVVGQDSATLVATTVGGAGGPPEFQWFTGENCVPGNEIVGANTDTYVTHVSGVFSCKAWIIDPDNCADCDSTEATVIDCSAPVALPISEGFESTSGTALPICWSYQNYDGDTRFWTTSSTNPHAGLRAAYIQASVSGTIPNDWLYIPIVALNAADDYLLTFWWREGTVLSTYFDSLEVLLTTGPDNISTVSVIVPIFRAATSTYQETMAIFSPPADGNYYVAFRYTGGDADGGIRVDDISLEVAGNCTAPTVSVADSTAIGTVAMFCSATGGSGGPLQYQWYTGQTCTPGNEIVGANSASYSTTISGDYACKAWRYDPDICSACDWGTATVTPAPPGYDCSNPISLAGEEGNAPYNNCGMGDMSPGQDCGTAGNNSGEDMVFVMTVPAGNQASIWQSVNTFDSRHSLRWGGDCPGTNLVGCVDTPDTLQYVWVNNTGETQNLYFVVGGYNNTTLCGDFTLQWYNYPPCPNVTCTPTFTETGNNSGCGVDSTFNTVSCTDVISGTVFATPTLRDVDAYEVTLTGYTDLTVTVNPEFDAILQVRFGGCSDYLIGYANAGGLCDPETVTVNSIPAGVVHIYVYAPFIETVGDQSYCVTMSCSAGEAPDIVQDFEADNGAWDATPATGGWEWGQPTAPDGPPAAHSGVNVWGTVLAGDYPSNACWTLDLDLGLTVDEPTASLRCWMWYDTETNYDGCQFHVSVDGGANWILVTPEGGYPQSGFTTNACLGTTTDYWGGNSGGWILVSLPLGAFENQVPIFRFWFGSDPSVTYPGVFIDDIELFGVVGTNDGPPQPVTNLQAQVVDHDVTLTWLDPTQDVIGNPIVVDSVQIWLGAVDTGTRLGAVGAGVQTFVHQDAQDGLAIYVLRPYNNGSAGGTTSVNAIVGNPYYVQDFETDGGAWVADGGWEWGQPTDPDGPTAHSGINVWGTVLAGDYANNACYNLTLSPGVAVSSANATVEFWRWYDTEANFDGCNFNVSVDGGTTWEVVTPLNGYPGSTNTSNSCNPSEPAWTDHNGDSWVYDVIPIGQYIGATPQFRFTFGSDISIVYPGFFFDDMTIWGLQSCQPDTVDDLTVYRDVALSNDVHLRWSGDPAMEGTYTVYWNNTMDVFPGSWTVLAGGLAPAADMEYVDVGVVTAAAKRYYLIVSECSAVVAASKPVPIAPGAQK